MTETEAHELRAKVQILDQKYTKLLETAMATLAEVRAVREENLGFKKSVSEEIGRLIEVITDRLPAPKTLVEPALSPIIETPTRLAPRRAAKRRKRSR